MCSHAALIPVSRSAEVASIEVATSGLFWMAAALCFLKCASSRQPELSNLSDRLFGGCRHCAVLCLRPSCLSSLQVMMEATVDNLKMIILESVKVANIRQYKPVMLPRFEAHSSLQSDRQDLGDCLLYTNLCSCTAFQQWKH